MKYYHFNVYIPSEGVAKEDVEVLLEKDLAIFTYEDTKAEVIFVEEFDKDNDL